jgi:hypothetical protein
MQLLTSRHSARLGVAMLFLITFTASGCGSKAGKVRGTVNFDGRPLPAGQITFKGQNESKVAEIIDGKYTIDAPLGQCKVGIQTDYLLGLGSAPGGGGASGGPDFSQLSPEERREKEAKMRDEGADVLGRTKEEEAKRKKDAANYVEIPESYNDPEMSGLSITVGKGSQDAPAFDLKSPPGWQPTKKAQAQAGAAAGGGPGMPPGGMPPGGMPPGGRPPGLP